MAIVVALVAGTGCDKNGGDGSGGSSESSTSIPSSATFTQVSAGGDHTCALTKKQNVYCWGGMTNSPSQSFQYLSSSSAGTCGVTEKGSVECWFPENSTVMNYAEGKSGNFKKITAQGAYICGITQEGAIECWGSTESKHASESYQRIATSMQDYYALTEDGTVKVTETDTASQGLETTEGWSGTFKDIDSRLACTCGVKKNGALMCDGMCPDNKPADGSFQQVRLGKDHACAIASDQSITCWGKDKHGRTEPPSGSFQDLSAGSYHTCAVTETGDVKCWGTGSNPDKQEGGRMKDSDQAVVPSGA